VLGRDHVADHGFLFFAEILRRRPRRFDAAYSATDHAFSSMVLAHGRLVLGGHHEKHAAIVATVQVQRAHAKAADSRGAGLPEKIAQTVGSEFGTVVRVEENWQSWCGVNTPACGGGLLSKEKVTPSRRERVSVELPNCAKVG
jgi:hypothetical protein